MRFTVEPWAPEYGSAGDVLGESEAAVEPSVEVDPKRWNPIAPPSGEAAESILFVDGVRRVDATVWVGTDGPAVRSVCASYAAGAVRCDGRATILAREVRRGLFTCAPGAAAVQTPHAHYEVEMVAGTQLEQLWLGIQERMGELEGEIASRHPEAGLVVVDGPLTGRQRIPGAIGYVKTHRVDYLGPALSGVVGELRPGERTPLFLMQTAWSRYSWYLRLPGPAGHAWAGVVRCEASASLHPPEAVRLADLTCRTLPRFASAGHKDPRAPQNLYPIAGLERSLRRLLGDPALLYRSLRKAAGPAA